MTTFAVGRHARSGFCLLIMLSLCLVRPGVAAGPGDGAALLEDEVACEPCDDGLTGDWGGHRRSLAQQGLEISLENVGDVFFIGQGDNHESTYTNLFSAAFSLDMEKLASISGGSAYLWIVDTVGDNPAEVIGSIHAPSNIAAASAVRLLEAWY
ncbi:MAG: hypothetical protein PVI98_13880, partial [Burkholderiales bacterium]